MADCPLTTSVIARWSVAVDVPIVIVQFESSDVFLAKARMTTSPTCQQDVSFRQDIPH